MANIFASLLPVFALIILGSLLKYSNMFPRTVWTGLENLVYWVLLPALLIVKLGNAQLDNFDVLPMGGAMAAGVVLVVIGLCVIRSLFKIKQKSFTSVLQGAIRQNSYIGLAAAGPLYGVTGEALAAVGIAAVIPLVNVISLWSLLKIGSSKKLNLIIAGKQLIKSPIIIGCAIGISANTSGIGVPVYLSETLDLLGGGALPLGLLCVGAGLNFMVFSRSPVLLIVSNSFKLILIPIVTALLCELFEVDPIAKGVAVLFSALPSSASSYVMARQFGGDHELMAGILTTQVMMATITIPVILNVFT
jgi:malonate transporter